MQITRISIIVTFFAVVLVLLLGGQQRIHAQGGYPPRTEAYVNDYAGVISEEDAATLRSMLRSLQAEAGIDGTILTIDDIDDYPTGDTSIESFATNLFNTWGIDDAQTNDGFLIVVAIQNRRARIELGEAYGQRYNNEMQHVIDEEMLPHFREAQYSAGIVEGTDAVIRVVTGEVPADGSIMSRFRGGLAGFVDRLRNNRVIAAVLALLGLAGAFWRRFVYLARGGCLREVREFVTSMLTGALVGGFAGSIVGMITVDVDALEQTIMQAIALFETGRYWQEFSLLAPMLWLGAGVGALIAAIFRLMQGGRHYQSEYGGSSGGGSSSGGGASGGW